MATRSDRPRFVFVLGTGRCGSTLVHEVIARHSDVGFVSNVDDRLGAIELKGRWNQSLYRWVPTALTRKGRVRYAPSEAYAALDRRVSPAISTPFRDLVEEDATPWLADRFRRFFVERAEAQGKPVFLHKFTGWPRARFIHAVLPEARFVHVVRDGRAVANSLLQMPWWRGYAGPEAWTFGPLSPDHRERWERHGRSFPVLAGLEWRTLIEAFEAARSAMPDDRWLELRYEDFVADPRRFAEAILEHCGLRWNDRFEASFDRYAFRSDRTDAFRRDLLPEDVAALEDVLAEPLRRHGYLVSGPSGSDAGADQRRGRGSGAV